MNDRLKDTYMTESQLRYNDLLNAHGSLEAKYEKLIVEHNELLEESFMAIAHRLPNDSDGWWDTCALSSAMELGDALVKLGTWEKNPDGVGRRWFYRKVKV